MKHNLLRRLSAFSLALVMAASLCLTPAWAAPGDPDATNPTPVEPDPNTFAISTEVIVFPVPATPYTLTASGVPEDLYVKWEAPSGVQINNSSGTVITQVAAGKTTSSVTVTATGRVSAADIKVTACKDEKGDDPYTKTLHCYAYSEGNSPLSIPDALPELTVGEEKRPLFSYTAGTPQAVKDFFAKAGGVSFVSIPSTFADTSVAAEDSGYRVTINPKQSGTGSFRMTLPGGFSKLWSNVTINPAPGTIPVETVTLETDYLSMTAKDTHDPLKVTVKPDDATNKTVIWRSNDSNVVRVNTTTGEITAVGEGRTSIYATADRVRSNECIVEVKAAPNSVTLDHTTLQLNAASPNINDKRVRLKATGDPAARTTYAWRTSNAAVADFNGASTATGPNPFVLGKKEGTAVIMVTATFADKTTATAQCTVTVLDANSKPVNRITLSEDSHSMPEDGSFNLSVTSFDPANVLDKSVAWTNSARDVVELETVNQTTVKVKAQKAGTARITATANFGGANKICAVTVTPKAENITLSGFTWVNNTPGTNKYTYTFGNTGNDYINVRANLAPTGAADPIHWASKNPAVATVSNTTGTQAAVTAVGPGQTTITAVPMDPAGKDRVLESGAAEITVTVSGISIVNDDLAALSSLTLMENQRRQIQAQAFGSAYTGDHSVDWTSSDPSVVTVSSKSGATTTLTGIRAGKATITARKGSYVATCSITVTEDTAGLITVSTAPGVAYQFKNIASSLDSACRTKTGAGLSYVTNLSVSSTDQGILHDQHHSSADTGAGVGVQDRYYPDPAPQGQRALSDLSFVPRNTFSGTAEISYTAWSTNNQSVNGIIHVTVNGTGDVSYASNEGSPVTFLADDFNIYHPNLRSVTFTLPLESRGTLYYGYTSASQPGTKVAAGAAYYRTGTPSLDRVSFVPASGYQGTVTISYTATDTSGRTTPGRVTITVGGGGGTSAPGDIYYPVAEDSWVTFKPSDFSNASRSVLGETLSYVRFSLPPSSDGTLFYNYRGFGSYDGAVSPTTSYYYSGTPALSGVSFVPTTTTPSQVDISYTGYTVRGNTFTGTIHIGQSGTTQPGGLRYTVFTGKSVSFIAADFNAACVAATGASLSYVQFSPLPAVGSGTLRYHYANSSYNNSLSTSTRCYYSSGSGTNTVLLSNVSFLANNSFTGTVTIPFTGYNTNNVSFTGEVVIDVTPPTSGDSVYYGTTARPLALSSSRMRSACSDVLDGTLSYITFTGLPSASAGKLYLNYSGFGTGTQVNTGTRYYVSGSPSIDQISFVPRGRYTGQVSVGYTATNTSGKSVNGLITFNITSSGNSTYFSDMGYHTWAGPAVDYLYQNGVTNGVTASTYGPETHILRCDFVLMLCRAFHFTGGSGYSFADVPVNAYYADAVATAKQLGIVNGDGVNFMPNSELTRQDAMVMFKNALDAAHWNVGSASTSVLSTFPDGASVAGYARSAVSTLVQLGAVSGDNGMLYPYNPITRAEAAVILHFVMTM